MPVASRTVANLVSARLAARSRRDPYGVATVDRRSGVPRPGRGLPTDIVTVAARPADGSFTAVLLVQILTDFDLRVLDEVLASIRLDP